MPSHDAESAPSGPDGRAARKARVIDLRELLLETCSHHGVACLSATSHVPVLTRPVVFRSLVDTFVAAIAGHAPAGSKVQLTILSDLIEGGGWVVAASAVDRECRRVSVRQPTLGLTRQPWVQTLAAAVGCHIRLGPAGHAELFVPLLARNDSHV